MSVIADQISKVYGKQPALVNVSFTVETGTIMGILGPNGAGKSTLLKIISGYLDKSSGSVRINGLEAGPEELATKKLVGYLPENNPLYPDLYVREYLDIVAGLYQVRNKKGRVAEMIELTGLAPEAHKKIGVLSKGYRQRVGLAQALLHDPAVLILDEPTSALDPAQLVEIRQLIRNVSANKTVLFSTHIMQEVEAICDRVLILNQGRLVTIDTPEKIKKQAAHKTRSILVEFLEEADARIFTSIPGVERIERIAKNQLIIHTTDEDLRPAVFRVAVSHNLTLLTLREQESTMERSFLDLVG